MSEIINSMEFKLNLIMKTDEILKSWNIIKKLITDDFIADHPDFNFEAFDVIGSNLEAFKDEMEMCAVGELNYIVAKNELKYIRDTINEISGGQIEMIAVSDNEDASDNEDDEKVKAQKALDRAFDNMESKGAKIEQIFPQGE